MTDEYIIKTFFNSFGKLNGNHSTEKWLKDHEPETLKYLNNRFKDSESLRETFLRIWFKIEERPKCPICGEPRSWRGKKQHMFNDTCAKGYCYCKLREKKIIEKYGIPNFGGLPESIEKGKKTKIEKYGDPNYHNVEQMKITQNKKYGGIGFGSKEVAKKAHKTIIDKYGGLGGASKEILDNIKKTCIEKYGVDNYRKSKECVEKIIESKKRNGTINTSSIEERVYKYLCEEYGIENIIRQYKDERYKNPINDHFFHCDFYIKKLDVFIEIQGHWGHGKHPFDKDSKEDLKVIEDWSTKTKGCYKNAINSWTVIDPMKRKVAKENNLLYIEIFNIHIEKDELIKTIKNYLI